MVQQTSRGIDKRNEDNHSDIEIITTNSRTVLTAREYERIAFPVYQFFFAKTFDIGPRLFLFVEVFYGYFSTEGIVLKEVI